MQSDESQIKKEETVDITKSSKEKESCVLCNGYDGEVTQQVSN